MTTDNRKNQAFISNSLIVEFRIFPQAEIRGIEYAQNSNRKDFFNEFTLDLAFYFKLWNVPSLLLLSYTAPLRIDLRLIIVELK